REKPVERGETTEQKEDADQVDPEGSRESHPGAMFGRRDEVENPHRKKAPPLDAWMDIDETDLATVHPHGRLARTELGDEAREESRAIEPGLRLAPCVAERWDPAAGESDKEDDLATPQAVREGPPQNEGGDRGEARRVRNVPDIGEAPAEGVCEEGNQRGRRAAGDPLREVRVEPVRPIRAVHPIPRPLWGRRTRADIYGLSSALRVRTERPR